MLHLSKIRDLINIVLVIIRNHQHRTNRISSIFLFVYLTPAQLDTKSPQSAWIVQIQYDMYGVRARRPILRYRCQIKYTDFTFVEKTMPADLRLKPEPSPSSPRLAQQLPQSLKVPTHVALGHQISKLFGTSRTTPLKAGSGVEFHFKTILETVKTYQICTFLHRQM